MRKGTRIQVKARDDKDHTWSTIAFGHISEVTSQGAFIRFNSPAESGRGE